MDPRRLIRADSRLCFFLLLMKFSHEQINFVKSGHYRIGHFCLNFLVIMLWVFYLAIFFSGLGFIFLHTLLIRNSSRIIIIILCSHLMKSHKSIITIIFHKATAFYNPLINPCVMVQRNGGMERHGAMHGGLTGTKEFDFPC